jgi:hypothetical protein
MDSNVSNVVSPHTRLEGKEYSPLIMRRYSTPVLHLVTIITDDNLDDFDNVVRGCWRDSEGNEIRPTTIQGFRNLAGQISEAVYKKYPKTEGIAVTISADKMIVNSLFGDFMVHQQCREELFALLNFVTNV